LSASYRTPPRPDHVNYDEQAVPAYTLPDPLRCLDGTSVSSAAEFDERRRPELLELFAREVYGRAPAHRCVDVEPVTSDGRALGGLATRLELDVRVTLTDPARELVFGLLAWIPNGVRSCPAFLGLNLAGNQTLHPDPAIRLSRGWAPYLPELGLYEHRASDASRGMHAKRWPVELAITRGFALVTAYAGEIEPDYPAGASQSSLRSAVTGADAPGSIALWAFGLSRALDAISSIEGIDHERVAVIGHSRLGKAALWAAALDRRFAMVVANSSGRGGAALSRRRFGETTRDLNARFPHWFCSNFRKYDDREVELPVDQHELLALAAPRPLYLGNAEQDLWCDPNGELLAALGAEPAYRLFGHRGLNTTPDSLLVGRSYGERIGYHRRPGGHDLLATDFWHYLAFAEREFQR
jgi:hypothetical protein